MVEKIDFTKSGATDAAREYAETITLEMCKHTAQACGFVAKDAVPCQNNAKWMDKRTALQAFFFTLGVSSLTGFKRRFYSEKLPEPFPGLTPLLHDRVGAIPESGTRLSPRDSFSSSPNVLSFSFLRLREPTRHLPDPLRRTSPRSSASPGRSPTFRSTTTSRPSGSRSGGGSSPSPAAP